MWGRFWSRPEPVTDTVIYHNNIYVEGKPSVICFSADWCFPCQQLGLVLDNISDEFPDVLMLKVDIEKAFKLTSKFNIGTIPSMVFFKNGSIYDLTTNGMSENELRERLKNLIK